MMRLPGTAPTGSSRLRHAFRHLVKRVGLRAEPAAALLQILAPRISHKACFNSRDIDLPLYGRDISRPYAFGAMHCQARLNHA